MEKGKPKCSIRWGPGQWGKEDKNLNMIFYID